MPPYGGVVPEIAARAHVELLDMVIAKAMVEAGLAFRDLDGIAAAAGPGLIGGVIVGLTTAKAIALVAEKPLIAVNHLEAHALTARLTDATPFPYCLFLASGGHTQILAVRGVGDYVRLGTTMDDAIGEAFDKVGKLLGLPYPGGPEVEREAAHGNPERFALPRPMLGRPEPNFSLSGLKTALRLEAEKIAPLSDQDVADLCASFQQAVVDVVLDRLRAGLRLFRERYGAPTALVAAGGVAANQAIRRSLHRLAFEAGTVLVAPPPELCTDNGAMIAWAGAERLARGFTDMLDVSPRARWPLDEGAPRRREPEGCDVTIARIAVLGAGAWGTALANFACAGRRYRDPVGARSRGRRRDRRDTAKSPPARHPARRRRLRHVRSQGRRRCRGGAARGAGPGRAGGRRRGCRRPRRGYADRRLRQGHRARHAPVHDRGHRPMRAGRRAGDPVGPELCGRRRARPADRRDARLPRRGGRGARSRARSARRRSGPITRPTCAASRSAAPPRTCWRSRPASCPGAGSARARPPR